MTPPSVFSPTIIQIYQMHNLPCKLFVTPIPDPKKLRAVDQRLVWRTKKLKLSCLTDLDIKKGHLQQKPGKKAGDGRKSSSSQLQYLFIVRGFRRKL